MTPEDVAHGDAVRADEVRADEVRAPRAAHGTRRAARRRDAGRRGSRRRPNTGTAPPAAPHPARDAPGPAQVTLRTIPSTCPVTCSPSSSN